MKSTYVKATKIYLNDFDSDLGIQVFEAVDVGLDTLA